MSANHTQHYQLSQWEATDKVERIDFNADNAKLDAALHSLAERTGALEAVKADKTSVSAKADQSALTSAVSRISALETSSASKTELNTVKTQLLHLAAGSYVGTGKWGSTSPKSLSFTTTVGFEPVLLAIMPQQNTSARCLLMFNGMTNTQDNLGGDGGTGHNVTVTWRSNRVTWYGDTQASHMDEEGVTYLWFALG